MQSMMKFVEENPEITLKTIKDKTFIETGTSVTTTTIHTYLEGRMLTIKKTLAEPSEMNSIINKEKRSEYVTRVVAAMASKHVIFIDETNVNLFLRRSFGR